MAAAAAVRCREPFSVAPSAAEVSSITCCELPHPTRHSSMLRQLPGLDWAAGLPRMQGAAMAAAASPAAGAELSALMLSKPARAISNNAAPGTSTRPLTLQGAVMILVH